MNLVSSLLPPQPRATAENAGETGPLLPPKHEQHHMKAAKPPPPSQVQDPRDLRWGLGPRDLQLGLGVQDLRREGGVRESSVGGRAIG